jgi:predicted ABC-type ATPase
MLDCNEFVNADEIAKGLSPFQPEKVSFEAGRIMLKRIDTLMEAKVDFAFETTLSTRSYVNTIKKAREEGYTITLLYFWLNSAELAVERVRVRVSEGGHNIPENTIRRRYLRGLTNLTRLFIPLADLWMIIDNSVSPFMLIAEGSQNSQKKIYQEVSWHQLNKISNEE